MQHLLEKFFVNVNNEPDIRAMVITGAGSAFSSGGDVKTMDEEQINEIKRDDCERYRDARQLLLNMLDCEVPIIAAVNGVAVGFGASIALLCDIIYADENARFGDTHVRVGLTLGDGSPVIWSLLCGFPRAKQYLMTGDLLSAQEA